MQKPLTIEEIYSKLKPIFGNKIDELYLRYAMSANLEEKEDIAHMLTALYQKISINCLIRKFCLNRQ